MAKKERSAAKSSQASTEKSNARSVAIAERGVRIGTDFADLMSALLSDIICGDITPAVGNAACNAGGKLLKIVEMQTKYGTGKSLRLAGAPTA